MPYKEYRKTTVPENVIKTEDAEMREVSNNGAEKETPAWLSKIKAGGVKKVPKDVQRRRRNYRLKRMMLPKPPNMVLFELIPHDDVVFDNFVSDPVSRLFKITAKYDDKYFEGLGPSKTIAKNICCERILQHIAFKACAKDEQENKGGSHGEEETPWTALASVALFKLFNDWQAQGCQMPAELMGRPSQGKQPQQGGAAGPMDIGDPAVQVKKEKERKEKKPKTLPENPTSRHPVQLLNEMEGQLEYETSAEGVPPHSMYTISVTLPAGKFSGTAKSKKEAKKLAAIDALRAVYNVVYPEGVAFVQV